MSNQDSEDRPFKQTLWGKEIHELKNSLAAILGYSALLRHYVRNDVDGNKYLDSIKEALRLAIDKTENLSYICKVMSRGKDTDIIEIKQPSAPTEPIQNAPIQPPEDHSYTQPVNEPVECCEQILIVEDDKHFRNMLEQALTKYGYQVVSAIDGNEGFEIFNRDPSEFDLVCLDRDLPFCDGLALSAKLRAIRPRLRMILLTGAVMDVEQSTVQKLGLCSVILKPTSLDKLTRSIRLALDSDPPNI
jgi:CheY-like chemotaxis protein